MTKSSVKPINILGAGLSGLSAAIILAQAGQEVHVHELRSDSGARFHGDLQAMENWTSPIDFFEEMRSWGLDPRGFKATDIRNIDLVFPNGRIKTARSQKVAFRLVERGTAPHSIDQGLKRQAAALGVQLHYNTRVEKNTCDIIATGPKFTTGIVRGELFHTSQPNQVTVQFSDKLAPGAYTYMIIVDGVGLICTVLMRQQPDTNRFLHETIAWYETHYPNLNRKPIRRITGVGCFALNHRCKVGKQYYVGEAGGMQDCLWGFGMRYAITSGYLAARSLLGGPDYELEVRRLLRPYQETSLVNRWLINCSGEWGMELLIHLWMKDQKQRGDGLPFVSRLYRSACLRRLIFKLVAPGVLKNPPTQENGLGVRYLPFAPAKGRDNWDLSPAGQAIAMGNRI
jgi:flavin-dependent dehydrogenase